MSGGKSCSVAPGGDSNALSYQDCVINPGWWMMRASYRMCFHTLYDEKDIYRYSLQYLLINSVNIGESDYMPKLRYVDIGNWYFWLLRSSGNHCSNDCMGEKLHHWICKYTILTWIFVGLCVCIYIYIYIFIFLFFVFSNRKGDVRLLCSVTLFMQMSTKNISKNFSFEILHCPAYKESFRCVQTNE